MRGSRTARFAVAVLIVAGLATLIHTHASWERNRDHHSLSPVFANRLPDYHVTVEDLDNDEMPEFILSSDQSRHIIPEKVHRSDAGNWNTTPYFVRNHQSRRGLAILAHDVTGDGRKELFFTFVEADTIWIEVANLEGEVLMRLEGASGVHQYGPLDYWDGVMDPSAVFEDPGTGHPFLLVCTKAGYDRYPRDIRAYDLTTGVLAWRTPLGAYLERCSVHDLDGDGEPEILVTTSATGNGGTGQGYDDNHTYLIALESDGSLMWSRTLGNTYTRMTATVVGGGADGPMRIVTSIDGGEAESPFPGRVLLVDATDGAAIDSVAYDGIVDMAPRMLPGTTPGTWDVFFTTMTGLARRYRVDEQSIELTAERRISDIRVILGPTLPDIEGGPLLIAFDGYGTGYFLDRSFRQRSRIHPENGDKFVALSTFTADGSGTYMVTMNSGQHLGISRIDAASLPLFPLLYFLLGYLVAVLLSYLVWKWDALVPQKLRIDDLMRADLLVDHGQLSVAAHLKDLHAMCTDLRSRKKISVAEQRMVHKLHERFLKMTLPEIRRMGQAGRSLPGWNTRTFDRHLEELIDQIVDAGTEILDPEKARRICARMAPSIELVLQDLARVLVAIKKRFSVDPAEVLNLTLERIRLRAQRAGVTLIEKGEWASGITVWGDAAMFAVVIDNLVSNAIDAVAGSETREVTVQRLTINERVLLEVSDTGCGIPEDHLEWIWHYGTSTRPGGTGRGLHESRRVLRMFRGDIWLEKTEPGVGSTFRLQFCRNFQRRKDAA